MNRLLAVLWLALAMLASPAAAQHFPDNQGKAVVDQANLLTPEQEIDLESKSQALFAQSGRAFVVATVNSLEGYPIEDYAYRLGRAWGIGGKEKDEGVLLLVAPNERKVWIATGYGAGGFMTDAMAGVITREAILPHFKQTPPDYGGGIEAGADKIIAQMSLPPDEAAKAAAQAQSEEKARRQSSGGGLPILFWGMLFAFILLSMFRRASGRRYRSKRRGGISPWIVLWGLNEAARASRGRSSWGGGGWGGGGFGGGGGGGGFGGFGGGSFGGGGAGGSW